MKETLGSASAGGVAPGETWPERSLFAPLRSAVAGVRRLAAGEELNPEDRRLATPFAPLDIVWLYHGLRLGLGKWLFADRPLIFFVTLGSQPKAVAIAFQGGLPIEFFELPPTALDGGRAVPTLAELQRQSFLFFPDKELPEQACMVALRPAAIDALEQAAQRAVRQPLLAWAYALRALRRALAAEALIFEPEIPLENLVKTAASWAGWSLLKV